MTRRWTTAVAGLCTAAAVLAGCAVSGQAAPDPAGVALLASSAAAASAAAASSAAITTPTTATTTDETTPSTSTDSSTPDTSTTPSSSAVTSTTPTTATSSRPTGPAVVIGAGTYSIDTLTAALWSAVLQAQGFRASVKSIDGDDKQLDALKAGQVDVVVAYNGSLAKDFDSSINSSTRADTDKKLAGAIPSGLTVGTSALADDRATVATSSATATKNKLAAIADLAKVSAVTLADPGSSISTGVVKALKDFYGVTVSKLLPADFGGTKTLTALKNGTATIGLVDNCQYQIDRDKLVQLADPQYMFASQNPIPVFKTGRLPATAVSALNAVAAKLTTAEVRAMQAKRFGDDVSVTDVATAWLQDQGLI